MVRSSGKQRPLFLGSNVHLRLLSPSSNILFGSYDLEKGKNKTTNLVAHHARKICIRICIHMPQAQISSYFDVHLLLCAEYDVVGRRHRVCVLCN